MFQELCKFVPNVHSFFGHTHIYIYLPQKRLYTCYIILTILLIFRIISALLISVFPTKVRDSNDNTFRFVSKSSDLIGYLPAMQFLGGRSKQFFVIHFLRLKELAKIKKENSPQTESVRCQLLAFFCTINFLKCTEVTLSFHNYQ